MPEIKKMYIDGEWVPSSSGDTTAIINPATGEQIAVVAKGTRADARSAVKAAKRAFYEDGWWDSTAGERAELLNKFADEMEANVDELARVETMNNGKTLTESSYDVYDSAACLRYYAGLCTKPSGQTYAVPNPNVQSMTVREPIGVVGMIVAWNFPISLAMWKLAPALAAGNTVVLKPASYTPLSAVMLFEMMERAGFPKGVVNLVLGSGADVGDELAANTDVEKIAFTGSIEAGSSVMRAAANNVKGICLELGGKSPVVVFDDADIATAVDYAAFGIFYNQGEVCSAGSRILVQDTIYDSFTATLVEYTGQIKLGNGLAENTTMGPLISKSHMEKVIGYIETGKKEGATLLCGGRRAMEGELSRGWFVEPTIFGDCTPDMTIVKEEIFGPVLCLQKFHTINDAIELANDTAYGLAAGVFTKDGAKALKVIKKIRAGITWINEFSPVYNEAPWGGYKQSGIGRELGTYGLDEFTEVKQININLEPAPTGWFTPKL
ncbi:aldehyde dehydrogenase family protein [Pectinatus haikarae]|uniref:aldehyde dehydrogenase family protein n=1 Tax=Pectinatus haikarae TaxID=349096 RepID=UPI0018C5CC92|nr:aldehyde dehydrogenase family protein [Pectinatus haikarae]